MTEQEKHELLETLSDCINDADEQMNYGIGDRLLDVIIALRKEWGFDEEEE